LPERARRPARRRGRVPGETTHQWAAYIGAKQAGDPPATHDWKRIAKNGLPTGYLVAQLVAVSWTPEQFNQVVWPTATDGLPSVGFLTEEEGGHGWHGDVYGEIRRGVAWF